MPIRTRQRRRAFYATDLASDSEFARKKEWFRPDR
jgi:hypothetical protein